MKKEIKCCKCGKKAKWITNDPFDIRGYCEKCKKKFIKQFIK